ncbi:hypothetical protein BT96DRAFT_1024840 [Gymnopus androsaceus JB14]|uniref:Uncharacterized protein n=1 Tax=Gymnopus androsaceus JB14 TaxID=1447944 RepID=A0A6A4GXW8_9AGAR|nr:hypothetical protein BT96DRAFT_1024840 [Gymnopus androsaceus JB14]
MWIVYLFRHFGDIREYRRHNQKVLPWNYFRWLQRFLVGFKAFMLSQWDVYLVWLTELVLYAPSLAENYNDIVENFQVAFNVAVPSSGEKSSGGGDDPAFIRTTPRSSHNVAGLGAIGCEESRYLGLDQALSSDLLEWSYLHLH